MAFDESYTALGEQAASVTECLAQFRAGFDGMEHDAVSELARRTLEDCMRSWIAFCALWGRKAGAFDTSAFDYAIDIALGQYMESVGRSGTDGD